MSTLAEKVLNEAIGTSCSARVYSYIHEDAQKQHERAAARPSGEVILWELAKYFQKAKFRIPKDLEPRSKYKPDMLIEPLSGFFKQRSGLNVTKCAFTKAYDKVMRAFFVGSVNPIDLSQVAYHVDTNSGAPFFSRKGEVYEKAFPAAIAVLRGKAPEPLTVFHRGKDTEKVRPVFGYPLEMVLIESMFFQPYQAELLKHHSPYVGGLPNVQVSGYVNEIRWKSDVIYELDYARYDQSLSSYLISAAFSIIDKSFEMTNKQRNAWELVKKYFMTAPVLLPDGSLIIGRRGGVPSGSMFTQLIDSICNCLIIEYVNAKENLFLTRYFVLGDDSIIGSKVKIEMGRFAELVAELGVSINVEKSTSYYVKPDQDSKFLGHIRSSFLLRRSIDETIRKILTPERLRDEYFSKDVEVRKEAYLERLRAYQEDNSDAWVILEAVIHVILGRKSSFIQVFLFSKSAEYKEKDRWDPGIIAFFMTTKVKESVWRATFRIST